MENDLFSSTGLEPLSLSALNGMIAEDIVSDRRLRDVWVVAETGDVRVSGGHCYLELIEKDSSGRPVARLRAIIWASQFTRLNTEFFAATGRRLESDMKVMLKVSISFHPSFGMSAIISDINPDYTCGDIMRRRRLIIQRLKEEGILDMNRELVWPDTPLRIAVISAKGAAGYGDFINQLYSSPSRFGFLTKLFPAIMQGESSSESIIDALNKIAETEQDFDCVVIIRGGGATGDLSCFDDYDLAANIAQFNLPVIVGIGHDRDRTVLDEVASVSVKTPTAAAEWLISRLDIALQHVRDIASEIFRSVTDKVNGGLRQLAYYEGLIPSLANARLATARVALESTIPDSIRQSVDNILRRHDDRLKSISQMIDLLSPQSVLKRGYSITRVNGHAVTDASHLKPGDNITTTLASGIIQSTVNSIDK